MAKLWRVKRRGKYIGSWRVTIKGKEINLQTQDANEATRRARLAAKGQWPQEEHAAEAVAAAFKPVIADGAANSDRAESSGAEGDGLPSPSAVAAGGAPLIPDVAPSSNWAADAGAAAADEGNPIPPPSSAADGAAIDPGVLDGMIGNAAVMLVELQLTLQAAAIRRFAKKEAAAVPEDFVLRAPAAKMWEAQLRIWLPKDLPLPPWGAALLMVGVMGSMQYAGAQPIDGGARA